MSREIIERGGEKFIVLPLLEFEHLVDDSEMLDDIRSFDEAISKSKNEERMPASLVHELVAGANAIRVYRNYRGMTQLELAEKAGIARAYLAQLETGKKQGSVGSLKAIAVALGLDLDDII